MLRGGCWQMLYKTWTISILFCYLIGTYHDFAFIQFCFPICSFRSLLFSCVLQLCTFAQFWLCIWLPDGCQSQFYWLVSLFIYLKFISNYNWRGVYLIALGSYIEWSRWFLSWVLSWAIIPSAYIIFVFLISFYDPGPHGNFRYSKNMLPEVTEADFRKGSQVILQPSLLFFLRPFWISDWRVCFDFNYFSGSQLSANMRWWSLQIVFTIPSSSFIAGWDSVFYLLQCY
jgi:hypothetical protein